MNKLNFGCGKIIKKGWVNVDIQKDKNIDKSFNFEKSPYPLKDNTFDYILTDNVLEHIGDLKLVFDEFYRISKNGAEIKIVVPYYNCKGAYNDITHVHFFNETTFHNLLNPFCHYGVKKEKLRFKVIKNYLKPTRFGKIIPSFVRKQFSYILGEVYSEIEVMVKVVK